MSEIKTDKCPLDFKNICGFDKVINLNGREKTWMDWDEE